MLLPLSKKAQGRRLEVFEIKIFFYIIKVLNVLLRNFWKHGTIQEKSKIILPTNMFILWSLKRMHIIFYNMVILYFAGNPMVQK